LIELNENGNETEQNNESRYQATKTSHPKGPESNTTIALILGNHQTCDQEARDAKENVNANPATIDDTAMKGHDNEYRESPQSIEAG
jgi:hypothetical protein